MVTTVLATSVASYDSRALLVASELAVAAAGVWLLWPGRRWLSGTTLLAAWWWALASWAALATALVARVFERGCYVNDAAVKEPLEMLVTMAAVLPGIAVLGAKRPQHVAWQWIVLSLWVVLALPAAQWLALGGEPSVHPARRWFLLALVAIGVANYLPTRYAVAALLFGFAQWLLLRPYLPWTLPSNQPLTDVGLILVVIALGALWRPVGSPAGQDPLDRVWRDFCDAYGLLWGLRVAERFNVQADKSGLPVRLGWRRFSAAPGQDLTALSPAERQAVVDQLSSWLRRFVDADWIARRLDAPPAG